MTPPKVLAKGEISKESMGLIPLLPLMIPSQVSATVLASGVTAPNPVITTRRLLNVVYRRKANERHDKEGVAIVDENRPHPLKVIFMIRFYSRNQWLVVQW